MRCHDCERDYACAADLNCSDEETAVHRGRYDEEARMIVSAAAGVEAEGYLKLTRIEEFALFCQRLGAARIGLAFCVGLRHEAALIGAFLESKGFELVSVCCKLGALPKAEMGHPPVPGSTGGSSCNPLGQAAALEGCAVIGSVGLCVGHDALLCRATPAPVVTLIAKDRVTGHNPAAVLYTPYLRRRLGL